jgi:hypothetical protein
MSATRATRSGDKSSNATTDEQAALRRQLIDLLHGGQAHATFDEVIKDLPASLRGTVPAKLP